MASSEYYDNFIPYQINTGINDRIYGLFKRLCKTGVSRNTRVLEIGCGIGSCTFLLSKKITSGIIEAIDISKKSIEYAGRHLHKSNITFTASDILDYQAVSPPFDRILLFDVLEHIPVSDHKLVFSKISQWMHEDSLLLINIPNPDYIAFEIEHNPKVLQEIDQPLYTDQLVNSLSAASMELQLFEKYSIWVKDDYHFFIVKKKKPFTEEKLYLKSSLLKKACMRLRRDWRRLIFNYSGKQLIN